MSQLRWDAIWRAAISVSLFLIPMGIIQRVLIDHGTIDKGGTAALVLSALILTLGAVAGFGAAKLARTHVLPNGAAAAALAYLIAQAAGLLRRAIMGGTIPSVVTIAYLALLMATCGMLGAALERRSRALREPVIRHDPDRHGAD